MASSSVVGLHVCSLWEAALARPRLHASIGNLSRLGKLPFRHAMQKFSCFVCPPKAMARLAFVTIPEIRSDAALLPCHDRLGLTQVIGSLAIRIAFLCVPIRRRPAHLLCHRPIRLGRALRLAHQRSADR